jgi:uncharacterized protein YjaZ
MYKYVILSILVFILTYCTNEKNKDNEKVIIAKDNGNIILAYKGFEKFLKSEKNWADYEKYVLNAFPALMMMHQRYIKYGIIDSALFRNEVSNYTLDDFKPYLDNMNEDQINTLYNSVIKQMDNILAPTEEIDVCLFLSNGKDCFMQDVSGRQTVCISIKYDIEIMPLIMIHEYAHCLHHQRRVKEPSLLKRWIVSEGIASFFPILVSHEYSIYDGLWMMTKDNIDWCMENESQIIDSLILDLDKTGIEITKKYIAGGEGFANPPRGFPEKTGYYIGYQIIEKCLNDKISLSELCKLDSETIIDLSGMFKNKDYL